MITQTVRPGLRWGTEGGQGWGTRPAPSFEVEKGAGRIAFIIRICWLLITLSLCISLNPHYSACGPKTLSGGWLEMAPPGCTDPEPASQVETP